MIRGIFKNSSAMQLLENKQEVISNNLANAVTSGYKGRQVAFQQLIEAEQAVKRNEIDVKLPKGQVVTYINNTDGALQKTGNTLDVALQGEGFFTINSPSGTVYSRNGQFQINDQGRLVTGDGYEVIGESGPIELTGKSFVVNDNGDILEDGIIVNSFMIRNFDLNENVSMVGNYFKPNENTEVTNPQSTIYQGYVERSNVNVIEEMTKMIMLQRHYEANQKSLHSHDESTKKSIRIGV